MVWRRGEEKGGEERLGAVVQEPVVELESDRGVTPSACACRRRKEVGWARLGPACWGGLVVWAGW